MLSLAILINWADDIADLRLRKTCLYQAWPNVDDDDVNEPFISEVTHHLHSWHWFFHNLIFFTLNTHFCCCGGKILLLLLFIYLCRYLGTRLLFNCLKTPSSQKISRYHNLFNEGGVFKIFKTWIFSNITARVQAHTFFGMP